MKQLQATIKAGVQDPALAFRRRTFKLADREPGLPAGGVMSSALAFAMYEALYAGISTWGILTVIRTELEHAPPARRLRSAALRLVLLEFQELVCYHAPADGPEPSLEDMDKLAAYAELVWLRCLEDISLGQALGPEFARDFAAGNTQATRDGRASYGLQGQDRAPESWPARTAEPRGRADHQAVAAAAARQDTGTRPAVSPASCRAARTGRPARRVTREAAMTGPVRTRPARDIARRGHAVAALTAVLLFCFATAAGSAARGSAASQAPGADPPAASTTAVQGGLGIKAVPAELVFLVDLSDSMFAPGGMYPRVSSALPVYLQWLAQNESQDRVVVIAFGRMNSAQVIFGPYPPLYYPYLFVPDTPEGSTDFGQAFSRALSEFNPLPSGADIKVGGVILLSDGVNDPEGDPQYLSYQSQAWAALRQRASELPVRVTGYALPLVKGVLGDQEKALAAVFGSGVLPLPNAAADLGTALRAAGQDVLDREVAAAAGHDSAKGVTVSWSGLPGPDSPLTMTKGRRVDRQG